MKKEVIMPKIGLDMDEGTILTWYKKVGDPVKKGEVLLEIETDKATTDVESEEEDETVDIGETIAWIEVDE